MELLTVLLVLVIGAVVVVAMVRRRALPSVAGPRERAAAAQPVALKPSAPGGEPRQEPEAPSTTMKLASLGDLAGGLAHEINNPVAIMVEEAGWMADLLDEEEFASCTNLSELRRSVRQIQTQGARVREITRNLLSFAQRTAVKIEKVDVNEVVREVLRLSASRAADGGVSLGDELASALPVCRASASGLQQVLVNLVNNAIDATQPGGTVTVKTRGEGDYVVVTVSDTGRGIPKEDIARIFDPFFTTKPVGKGTGLGLSICHGIVLNMNGTIAVESTPGQGTNFSVRLNAAEAAVRTQASAVVSDPGATGEPMDVVVLIVDDEAGFVEVLGRRLERRGAKVLSARTGAEALRTLEAHHFVDVVLLDVRMPGMDGPTALGEIKRTRPLAEVILLSGQGTLEAAVDGMKAGAFDYALKPCDVDHLLSRIMAAKRRKESQENKILEARIKEITMRRL